MSEAGDKLRECAMRHCIGAGFIKRNRLLKAFDWDAIAADLARELPATQFPSFAEAEEAALQRDELPATQTAPQQGAPRKEWIPWWDSRYGEASPTVPQQGAPKVLDDLEGKLRTWAPPLKTVDEVFAAIRALAASPTVTQEHVGKVHDNPRFCDASDCWCAYGNPARERK